MKKKKKSGGSGMQTGSFLVDMSESGWENECLFGVKQMNERFIENVRIAATRHIGCIRSNVRKRVNKA